MRRRKDYIKQGLWCLGAIAATYALALTLPTTHLPRLHDDILLNVPYLAVAAALFASCLSGGMSTASSYDKDDPAAMVRGPILQYVLPVTTLNLVLMPMAISVFGVVAIWGMYSAAATLPLHTGVPVLLPMLALTLEVTAGHASGWLIRVVPRLGCLFIFVTFLCPIGAIFAVVEGIPMVWPESILAVLIVASVWTAIAYSPNARHSIPVKGQSGLPKAKSSDRGKASRNADQTFASRLQAQIWFRSKQRVYMMGAVIAGFFSVMWWGIGSIAIRLFGQIGMPSTAGSLFGSFPFCVAMCCFASVSMASGFESQGRFQDGKYVVLSGMDPFLAVRPTTTAEIVLARILTSAMSAIWTTGAILASSLLWLALPPDGRILTIPFQGRSAGYTAWVISLIVLVFPLLLATLTQAGMTVKLLPERLKRFASKFGSVLVFAVMFFGLRLILPSFLDHDADTSTNELLVGILTIVGAVLLAGKAILVFIASKRLIASRLLAQSIITRSAAYWALAVALLTAIVYAVVQPPIPLAVLGLAVALLVPANRILWHIILLDSTRHQ